MPQQIYMSFKRRPVYKTPNSKKVNSISNNQQPVLNLVPLCTPNKFNMASIYSSGRAYCG